MAETDSNMPVGSGDGDSPPQSSEGADIGDPTEVSEEVKKQADEMKEKANEFFKSKDVFFCFCCIFLFPLSVFVILIAARLTG